MRAHGSKMCGNLQCVRSSCQQNTRTQSAATLACTYASPGVSVHFKYFSPVICGTYFTSIRNRVLEMDRDTSKHSYEK
jgi:hypothetical protein